MKQALKFGIVSEVKPGFAKVYFQEDDIATDWWPVIIRTTLRDFESWPLNVQEHVACICDEQLEEGVILGAIHSNPEPPDPGAGPGKFRQVFEDGTYIEYNKLTHILTADVKGKVIVKATSDITAISNTNIKAKAILQATIDAPDIQLKGNVTVTGIIAAGGITAAPISDVPGADGKVKINGDIEIAGEVKAAEVTAGTVSLKHHVHGGVSNGTGSTGQPTP